MGDEQRPKARRVAESAVTMSHLMLPEDANPSWPAVPRRGNVPATEITPPGTGNVHGGTIMKLVDTAAGVAAARHARTRVVTARLDTMEFLEPVYVGDLVCLKASVNDVGQTSMEVGVRVEAENLRTGRVYHVSSAHLIYVALDERGRPTPVPALIAETPEERRRMAEARTRRQARRRAAPDDPSEQLPPFGNGRWFTAQRRPLMIGHRGAAAHAPENTFASFDRALELGADVVEMDIHQTRDGHLVVIHDDRLERTTTGHGRVADVTLAEIAGLDAGSWFGSAFAGERVPALIDVLQWARGRTRLALELKAGSSTYPGIEERLCALLAAEDVVDQTVVMSFDHQVIRRIKQALPALACGVLYYALPVQPLDLALAAGADLLAPAISFVTPELVKAAHEVGLGVSVWTANDQATIQRLIGIGVDAITTDRPDVATAAFHPV